MSRYAIRLAVFVVFSVLLAATPAIRQAYRRRRSASIRSSAVSRMVRQPEQGGQEKEGSSRGMRYLS